MASLLREGVVAEYGPPNGHGEAVGVLRAEVVGMRIVAGTERPERGHLVVVVERQGRDRLAIARDLRADSFTHALKPMLIA